MRASGSLRRPKRSLSEDSKGLGRPERTSKRPCRASEDRRTDGSTEISPVSYRTSSPLVSLPCVNLSSQYALNFFPGFPLFLPINTNKPYKVALNPFQDEKRKHFCQHQCISCRWLLGVKQLYFPLYREVHMSRNLSKLPKSSIQLNKC